MSTSVNNSNNFGGLKGMKGDEGDERAHKQLSIFSPHTTNTATEAVLLFRLLDADLSTVLGRVPVKYWYLAVFTVRVTPVHQCMLARIY